ncbi:50S ribosomal protein L4 [Arthrospira platensis BEA 1257B]
MVDCVIRNWEGEEVGQTTLELKVAKEENASHIVHRALVRQQAAARQGTASTKTRSEVRGGGRKPWRQKGTGREGQVQFVLHYGAVVVLSFGPKPRDYSVKMNRKERRLALRTAFQSRAEDIVVVEEFVTQLPRPKTKDLTAALARWGVSPEAKVLLVLPEKQENVYLSGRNVAKIRICLADSLNVYDVLAADKIVTTANALAKIQEVYGD